MLAELGPFGDVAKPVEVHVGTAVDSHQPLLPGSFPFHILLQPCQADGSGWLGDRTCVLEDVLHGRTDLVRTDGDHLVEQLTTQAKRLFAGLTHGDSIGKQPDLIKDDALAGRKGTAMLAASSGSTPITFTSGRRNLV